MMKKNVYKLSNIDCASCALEIEDGVGKLAGVTESNLNFILSKFYVTFNEELVSDEQIEECIHKSLSGVKIVQKNGIEFEDTYQEEGTFKRILFMGRKRKPGSGRKI